MTDLMQIVEIAGKASAVGNLPMMLVLALLFRSEARKSIRTAKAELVTVIDDKADELKDWADERFIGREEFGKLQTQVAVTEATCYERHKPRTSTKS